jgi:hypothetical protein
MELMLALVLFFALIVAWMILPGTTTSYTRSVSEPEDRDTATSTTMQGAM